MDGNVARFCKLRYGVTIKDIYASTEIQECFNKFSVRELGLAEDGRILAKAPILHAFSDYYVRGTYVRHPSSYEVNSGICKFHDELLKQPHLNPDGKTKAIISIYRMIAEDAL